MDRYCLRHLLAVVVTLFFANGTLAKEFVTGEFIASHLKTNVYPIDSGASGVILYENEYTHIELQNYTWMRKRIVRKVIKVLKPGALSAGNVTVYYRDNDYQSYLANVKGTTYNLDGNEVVSTKIEKADLMKKAVSEGVRSVSFSLPGVKVGSVLDYSFEEVSPFFSELYRWHIQDEHPKLISIYSIVYPKYIEFTAISHLRLNQKEYHYEDDAERASDSFAHVTREYETTQKAYWIRRNIPAYKEEPFVVNEENLKERLEMQITGLKTFVIPHYFNKSWTQLNKTIWKEEHLGQEINQNNPFFYFTVDSLMSLGMNDHDKAVAIFKYVRDNFKCRDAHWYGNYGKIDLKKIWREKEGNIDDLNTLMVAMMVRAKLLAHPIILSTTDDISPNPVMPVLDRLSYLGCVVDLEEGSLLLDASDKNNPVGMFPDYCYNGYSWILGDTGRGVDIFPDMLRDKSIYNVKISGFTDSSAKMEIIEKLGMLSSSVKRKQWAKNKEKKQDDIDKIKHSFSEEIDLKDFTVNNADNPDTNLIFRMTCELKMEKGVDILYLNSAFVKVYEKNPFPAMERHSPIEFPARTEHAYYMSVVLPENMEPDTFAKPLLLSYNDGAMTYRRNMGYMPELHTITLNSSLAVNNTEYGVDEYPTLREFFQKMLDDNNQVLVIKKKKQ